MPSLWFVVPAHGRLRLSEICLRQLRRTCDLLTENGVRASAVVIADDANLDTARELRFATVRRNNQFLSRKFNDGIQLATDPAFNPRPVDYVVPCGSDDWVDHRLFLNLPAERTVVGFQRVAFVREDGREITTRFLNYQAGCGIRIYSRRLMADMDYRPADEDRTHGCDTSILTNLFRLGGGHSVEHWHLHDYQIVDWKTPGQNVTPYERLLQHRSENTADPFEALAGVYPDEALGDMRALYERALVTA